MLLSRRCEYALRAVLYLATRTSDESVPVREVSAALGIPHAFLAKTVGDLVRASILSTRMGSGGGLRLARPASEMTLKDVVLAVDGPGVFEECILRLPGCGTHQPCPLHDHWVGIRDSIDRLLGGSTLDTVAQSTREHRHRISELLDLPPGTVDPLE